MNRLISFYLLLGVSLSSPAFANKALAEKNGCLSCHAVDEKILGPAYQDVAKKYMDLPDAKHIVMQNILKGGSGRWGEIPMPAQSKLSKSDAAKLADWILKGAN
jgi:cytochrome c